jgi:hypothetical protein
MFIQINFSKKNIPLDCEEIVDGNNLERDGHTSIASSSCCFMK